MLLINKLLNSSGAKVQDLIFLGQIPFTDIYINFWQWLAFVAVATPIFIWLYRRRRAVFVGILGLYVAWLIRRNVLSN